MTTLTVTIKKSDLLRALKTIKPVIDPGILKKVYHEGKEPEKDKAGHIINPGCVAWTYREDRGHLPILNYVRLKYHQGDLYLMATNLEKFLWASIPVYHSTAGLMDAFKLSQAAARDGWDSLAPEELNLFDVCIHGRMLLDYAQVWDEKIVMTLKKGKNDTDVVIESGNCTTTLHTPFPPTEFPGMGLFADWLKE